MTIADSSIALPQAAVRPASPLAGPTKRIEFLDVLRGLAAIMVFLSHAYMIIPDFLWFSEEVMNIGYVGVAVFFVISGYIIPQSLLRLGQRAFWIRRILRIFPLYWFSLSFFIAYGLSGHQIPRETGATFGANPLATVGANLTLAQYAARTPNLVPNAWTLHYELIFYGVMSALLACGLLRHIKATLIAVPSVTLVVLQFFPFLLPIGGMRYLGVAIVLMFIGVTFFNFEQGQVSRRFFLTYLACAMLALFVFDGPQFCMRTALVPGVLMFFAGYLLRDRPAPAALRFLGRISYSVYLIHSIVLVLIPANHAHPHLTVLIWGGATLLLSTVTERWIEIPAIRLGRHLTQRAAETTA